MSEPIVILGAGGHGRVIADAVRARGGDFLGFLDDRKQAATGLPVLGRITQAEDFARRALFIIGVGDNAARAALADRFAGILRFAVAVHPGAVLAPDVVLGEGTVVMPGAVLNTGTVVGKHCIVNTAATADHDCVLEDFVHLSPGAHLAGEIRVGARGWVGAGAVVVNGARLCADCRIGAGGVVIHGLTQPGTYVGVPVRRLEPKA
mgnify:CR=1 FL=1